ncbi:taste receptor type 2 member 7-like [Sceloporus undulatus]|uniref:taste receptor type 2 member 7-like n=1 Tax=Sceloporus undulatus TaxID=8520 RepID=UPI001C4AC884|nr:taste receptor type 2 member 7-like [Sceloporus undulatus]
MFSWIIFGTVSLIGILGNGLIIAVNGHKWLQNKKMVPCDFLLTCLSTSRFLTQLTILVNSLLYNFFQQTTSPIYSEDLIYIFWMLFNMVSHWCATWLSVFYCVKVTNFANPFFLWMKARINVLTPRMLGMSIGVSMVFYLSSLISLFEHKKCCNVTETLPGNDSQNVVFVPLELSCSSINFCLSTTASILLLTSLQRHTRNLKKSGLGAKDLSTQIHIKVMTSLLFCLFFYLFYFIGMIISTKNNYAETDELLVDILLSLFPSAHSVILILTNPKLKEMSARILNIRHRT